MSVRRIATLALFTAIALTVHVAEALIPLPLPIPGVKPGFANIVTLFMLFAGRGTHGQPGGRGFAVVDVVAVLLCRILLGALVAGRPVVLLYSLVGGLFAVAAQVITRRFVTPGQIWVCGAIGAVFHNAGQILVAAFITGTAAIIVYLPVLIIAGIITGVLTGLIAQLSVKRLPGGFFDYYTRVR